MRSARPCQPAVAGRRVSPSVVAGLSRGAHLLIAIVSGITVTAAWMGVEETFEESRYLAAILMTSITVVGIGQRLGLFSISALASPVRAAPKLWIAWTTAHGMLGALIHLLKIEPDDQRGWMLVWYGAGLALMMLARVIIAVTLRYLGAQGRLTRRAVIYGGGPLGRDLVSAIEADSDSNLAICGIFDDRGALRLGARDPSYPRLGNGDDLIAYCRATPVDLLIVSLPITAEERMLEIVRKLWVLPVDIRLAAHTSKLRFHSRAYSFVGKVPLIDLFDKPLAEWDRVAKEIFDRSLALVAILALSPLLLLISIAIRLDSPGPILFRQKRLGFNNQPIDVCKFRSMFVDRADIDAAQLVTKEDPRVTRVGRFIRRTSLDELPQLFNVIMGTLSLVGPRPHAIQAKAADQLYHTIVDGYFARHKVKPGITGWAQINGWRGETDTPEKICKRVEHDLYYIDNWSLCFDVYILARTPFAVLHGENAY